VANKFKAIQFEQEFIDKVIARVKQIYDQRKKFSNKEKQVLVNRQTAIEARRDKAEEKLFAGVISDEDFTRLRSKFRQELDEIQFELDKLESQKEINLDKVQQLALTRNVYETYVKAPPELQKLYLGFFWERFEVRGDNLVKAAPNRLIMALQWEKRKYIKFAQTQKSLPKGSDS